MSKIKKDVWIKENGAASSALVISHSVDIPNVAGTFTFQDQDGACVDAQLALLSPTQDAFQLDEVPEGKEIVFEQSVWAQSV